MVHNDLYAPYVTSEIDDKNYDDDPLCNDNDEISIMFV